jgi:hypothetical protein
MKTDKKDLAEAVEKCWKGSKPQKENAPPAVPKEPKAAGMLYKEASEEALDGMMQKEGV